MHIDTLNLALLEARDATEIRRLASAAQSPGYFYLDMRSGSNCDNVLHDVAAAFTLAEKYFDQTAEQKREDVRLDQEVSQDRGFKKSDCDETFEMAYDELIIAKNANLPSILQSGQETLTSLSMACHSAALTMLSCLSDSLGLKGNEAFESRHQSSLPSDSGLKLIYEPALDLVVNVKDNTHTDSGIFTLLFYDHLGLQMKDCEGEGWIFTPVERQFALVNVADSLNRMSCGAFHSPTHRVTQVGDGFMKRYFLSYFLRPAKGGDVI